MVKRILIISSCFALGACSMLETLVEKGAETNDKAITTSIFTLCKGASVGAVSREFNTPAKADLWSLMCSDDSGFILAPPD